MNHSIKSITVICIISLCISCHEVSSQAIGSHNDAVANQIDSLLKHSFHAQSFSGSVLVADQGNIIHNKAYGYMDLDQTKEIKTASVFEIASLSKQFTALLIMILEEKGKLSYDDKLIQYFPKLPYKDISIRHLLTHTSGLSEKQFFMWAGQNMDPKKIYTNELILTYLEENQPELAFEPGGKWEYSNVGYFLLALIIQETSQTHYIQFLKEKIIKPLEMESTGIFSQELKGNDMDTYVFGKVFNPKDSVFMSSFGMAWSDSLYGGVGIVSNTTDLFRWDRALKHNKLVKPETIREALTPYKLKDGTTSNYGFGWFVKEDFMVNDKNCGKRIDHYGVWPGYESSIVRYIDSDKTIIILSNQAPSNKDALIEEISELLFQPY